MQSASEAFIGGWANTLHYLPHHDNRVRYLCDGLLSVDANHHSQIATDLTTSLKDLHFNFSDTTKLIPSVSKLPDNPKKLQARLHKAKNNHFLTTFLNDVKIVVINQEYRVVEVPIQGCG